MKKNDIQQKNSWLPFRPSSKVSLVSYIVAFVAGITAVGLSIWIGGFSNEQPPDIPLSKISSQLMVIYSVLSLSIGFLVSLIFIEAGDRVASNYIRQERDSELKDYADGVNNNLNALSFELRRSIQYYSKGSPRDALKTVLSNLQSAFNVSNTYISYDSPAESSFSDEDIEVFAKAMRLFLEKPENIWRDIVGGPVNQFAKRMEGTEKSNIKGIYECYRLKNRFPILNFIIIDYRINEDIISEVYFGWGGHKNEPYGHVISSNNRLAVDMFKNFFNTLCGNEIVDRIDPISMLSGTQNETEKKETRKLGFEGYWVDFSIKIEDGKISINDISLIEILLIDSGIEVKGVLIDNKIKRVGKFNSKASRQHDSALWFVYEKTSEFIEMPDIFSVGGCVYEFQGSPFPESFSGAFVDDRSSREIKLYGCKINNDEWSLIKSSVLENKRKGLETCLEKIKQEFSLPKELILP